MRILLVSDLHYFEPWFDWLRSAAPAHDLLIIAGDLLDQNHPASHARQIERVSDLLSSLRQPLAVCSGNHDRTWNSARSRWEAAHWLTAMHGPRRWTRAGIFRFGGTSFLLHHFREPIPRGRADIWITHLPPAGTLVAQGLNGRDEGDVHVSQAVLRRRPRLLLCGHEHQPVHWRTRLGQTLCLNPGRNRGSMQPNHVVIDTTAATATWRPGDENAVYIEKVELPRRAIGVRGSVAGLRRYHPKIRAQSSNVKFRSVRAGNP